VASSFGSGLGMLWLPDMQRTIRLRALAPSIYLRWSSAWAVATAVVVGAFLYFIDPGLK